MSETSPVVLIWDYEDWLVGRGLSRTTVDIRVAFALSRLLDWGTFERTQRQLAEWLAGYNQWTRRTYHSHLKSLYAFLVEVGYVETNPILSIRQGATPTPRPKPLTPAQFEQVLSDAPGNLGAWLLLGAKAGLRAHEIAKFRGEDIDDFGITVHGKGGKVARLPLHDRIRDLAVDYPSEGWWFPSPHGSRQHISSNTISSTVHKHFASHGLTGSIHRCRATYGTELARNAPIHVVQDLMRHSSLASTQHYLGVDQNQRNAAIASL